MRSNQFNLNNYRPYMAMEIYIDLLSFFKRSTPISRCYTYTVTFLCVVYKHWLIVSTDLTTIVVIHHLFIIFDFQFGQHHKFIFHCRYTFRFGMCARIVCLRFSYLLQSFSPLSTNTPDLCKWSTPLTY